MSEPVSLLCLPCAGASAIMYSRWQRLLPDWIRVVPVELPGRGALITEAFVDDYEVLVERLCDWHSYICSGRYALYGHSMGALIAYGMALRWRSLSQQSPSVLFVSASPSPKHRDPGYFASKTSDAALIDDLRKHGGTPPELFNDAEMRQIMLDTLRADYRVCSSYQHRDLPPLATKIRVFAGREDDIEEDHILAWEGETSERFSIRWFSGGHFFIREHQAAILDEITQNLRESVR